MSISEHDVGAIDPPAAGDGLVSSETVSLLLEEVSRLEAELQARDLALAVLPSGSAQGQEEADLELKRRVDELTSEVAAREETILVLLEETRLYEEAANAQREEWEQLSSWLEQVEQRVDGQAAAGPELEAQLAAERRRSEELALRLDVERTAWETQKRRLEKERDALRNVPARPASEPSGAVENELRHLRAECAALEEQAAAATAELEPLHERLAEAEQALAQQNETLRQERDEWERVRNELESTVSGLRAQLACASLQRPAEPKPGARNGELNPDERIRAFRQHLSELHEREAEQRASRSLAGRLSRLWKQTGPARS